MYMGSRPSGGEELNYKQEHHTEGNRKQKGRNEEVWL